MVLLSLPPQNLTRFILILLIIEHENVLWWHCLLWRGGCTTLNNIPSLHSEVCGEDRQTDTQTWYYKPLCSERKWNAFFVIGIYREATEGVCGETRGEVSYTESPWPHPTPRCDRRLGTTAICGRSLQHALTDLIPKMN